MDLRDSALCCSAVSCIKLPGQRKSTVRERNAEEFSLMGEKNKPKETRKSGQRCRRKPREKSFFQESGGLVTCVADC